MIRATSDVVCTHEQTDARTHMHKNRTEDVATMSHSSQAAKISSMAVYWPGNEDQLKRHGILNNSNMQSIQRLAYITKRGPNWQKKKQTNNAN